MFKFDKILISEEEINHIIDLLATKINEDYKNETLVIIGLLKGAMPFMMDLIKKIKIPTQIDFMQISSYHGGVTAGELIFKKDIELDVKDKNVLILDDIIDTGETLKKVKSVFEKKQAKSIEFGCLLDKPQNRKVDIKPKYVGKVIDNLFVVGYGLDYKEYFRNLPYVAILDTKNL